MRYIKVLLLITTFLFSANHATAQPCISLSSPAGTDDQRVCINSQIINIVYTLGTGVTGASASGLPAGVNGVYSPGLFTISGIPTVSGTFNYTITLLGTCPGIGTAAGRITVDPLPTVSAGPPTTPFCQGGTSAPLGGSVGGSATGGIWSDGSIGGSFSPSSADLNASWIPPASFSGTATLTLTTTGGTCGTASASKSQLVNPNAVITPAPGSGSNIQAVCLNSPIVNIIYSVSGGGTGAGVTGLPAGVTGSFSAGVFTISGIPIVAGTFNYVVTTTGTCVQATASGTIIVNSLPSAIASNNGPVCVGTPLNLTGGPGGLIAYSWTHDSGWSSSLQSPQVSASATSAMAGVYTLRVTNSNGCQNTATTTVVVNPLPVATALNNGPVCTGAPLILAGGPSAMSSYSWTGPNGFMSNIQSPTVSLTATPAMAGTYTLTVVNSNGCRNTASTIVVVNALPVATASNNGPVCAGTPLILTGGPAGMSSYLWSGPGGFTSVLQSPTVSLSSTIVMAGIYTLTVIDGNGCRNTAATTVVVNPQPVATAANSGPVCVGLPLTLTGGPAGMTTYSWSGPGGFVSSLRNPSVSSAATLGMAGVYTLTVTNTTGCQDTATTRVSVYAVPVANAGTGGTECDLDFVLNAVPSTGTGLWTLDTGPGTAGFLPNANTPTATVTVSAYGTYSFRWTETNGPCSGSSVVTVIFYPRPLANPGAGGNECDLDFALNAIPSSGIGTWTMTSGTGTATFFPEATNPAATVTVSEYGTKEFTWTEVSGSCFSDSAIIVNFYQQPSAVAGLGGNNCGLTFNLSAVPSLGTGTWTRESGPGGANATFSPDPNTPSARVTVTAYGTYVFRWTEVNGTCSSSATVSVTFIQQPEANAGNGGDECDLNFIFNATPGAGTGTWTKISGPGNAVFTPNANQYNATVTVSQFGSYDFAWTVVNNLCSSSDIIRVTFHDLPPVNAGADLLLCKGRSIQLNATGIGLFQWSPPGSLNNPSIFNPVASPQITTTYTVTLTDQWGCKNNDQVVVEVREQPVADAGPDQVLEFLFETNLEATPAGNNQTGEWTILAGKGTIADINSPSTYVSNLSLEVNSFIWTVTNGVCPVSSDTVDISVNNLMIPTLITPNLDGNNDYFIIQGIESLGKTSLTVFNRWGARVYENIDYDNSWDGVDDNGEPLQDDTYFFILKPEKSKTIKSYVVIRR